VLSSFGAVAESKEENPTLPRKRPAAARQDISVKATASQKGLFSNSNPIGRAFNAFTKSI
jgi:hypothetical protein